VQSQNRMVRWTVRFWHKSQQSYFG